MQQVMFMHAQFMVLVYLINLRKKKNTMLTDKNIDKNNAKYWCIFCENKIVNETTLNEAVMDRLVLDPGDDLAKSYKKYDNMSDAQKAASDIVLELRKKYKSNLDAQSKYIINGMNADDAQLVTQKLITDLDRQHDKLPASMARELGETFYNPDKIMPDGSVLPMPVKNSNLVNAIAGTEEIITGKEKSWINRVWDVVKIYFNRMQKKISSLFFGGEWDSANTSEKLAMLKTGGIHTLELIAIAYIVYKIRNWLFPQLKLAWKNIKSSSDLARCKFSDTNGTDYLCWFDKKKMQWQVKYNRGILTLIHKNDVFMTHAEEDAFFKTKFFTRFAKQCEKYISPYLDVERSKQQLKNDDTPSDVKKVLSFIVSNADKIRNNMFGMSYNYFRR